VAQQEQQHRVWLGHHQPVWQQVGALQALELHGHGLSCEVVDVLTCMLHALTCIVTCMHNVLLWHTPQQIALLAVSINLVDMTNVTV
jgi:hypothetical protein